MTQGDAYMGLVRIMKNEANAAQFTNIRIGEIVSLSPFKVRVGGLELPAENFKITTTLKENFELEGETAFGSVSAVNITGANLGTASGTLTATGGTMKDASTKFTIKNPLKVGDQLICLTNDNQTFYLIAKVVDI